jgi:hypothetical protein
MRNTLTILVVVVLGFLTNGCLDEACPTNEPLTADEVHRREQDRRQTYVDAHPDLSDEHKKAVLSGDIWPGMSKDELTASEGAGLNPRYVNAVTQPGLSMPQRLAMAKGEPWVGMNQEQLQIVWGAPAKRNQTVTAFGVSEQWVYRESYQDVPWAYAYLENGKLTAWQTEN